MVQKNLSDRARFGPFEVDLHTRELWKFGTKVKLVGQPFEILSVLLGRPLELVTREELRERLWPADTFVDFNHGLNAAVNKLREALSDSAENPKYVETLPRRGYRFIAAIEWLPAFSPAVALAPPISPAVIASEPPPVPSIIQAQAPAVEPGGKKWPRVAVGTTVLSLLLLAGTLLVRTVTGSGAGANTHAGLERTRPLGLIGAFQPAFSPDGNYLAFTRDDADPSARGIWTSAVGSDQPRQLTHHSDDIYPVWSPDGRSIAFSRRINKEWSIFVVPADGGAEQKRNNEVQVNGTPVAYHAVPASNERKIDTNGIVPQHPEIDWSADGTSIAFAGSGGIYLVSVENSTVHRLTEVPPLAEDWGPSISPDGKKVLFVRSHQSDLSNEIRSVSITGGDWTHIFSEPGRIGSPPRWSCDGKSVIFSSDRTGHPALWRVALDNAGSATQIAEAGSPAWNPALSRRGYRLAYERIIKSLSIWEMDVSNSGDKKPHLLVSSTSDTDQGPGPQFSPDGKKIAYMSDHSGTMEIWVSDRDGGNPFQLTAMGNAGTPRWSPDSQSIVFDSSTPHGSKIVRVNVQGGPPQILTPNSYHNVCPSWSHDGKWVYFASERNGPFQVWKVPSGGGTEIQVTMQGGHATLESPDGKTLYYAKSSNPEPEIWQVPVAGGEETPLLLVRPGTWASWQVVQNGILFVGPSLGHQAVLSLYDFAHRRTTSLAVLDRVPFWLGATADGQTIAFDQPGQEQAQAMLIENFR